MADLAEESFSSNLLLNRQYPRSPSSTSPASSRRDSLGPTQQGGRSEPATPSSPRSTSGRKRGASNSEDAATQPRLENLILKSTGNINTVSAGERVCLCQPDPKIPRPRNAFILYRQHYQAQVVALHPGLANPEISKIIGEQWTNQPAEVKNEWKRLAEEEKIRHQRQYPDYRYQPRRTGTVNHNRRISSSESPIRCPKCNGRYILTPKTPSNPSTPAPKVQYDRNLQPFASQATPLQTMNIEDRVQFPAVSNNTPQDNQSHSRPYWRPSSHQQNHASPEIISQWERRMSADMSSSPDFKRRRFNPGSQSHPSPPSCNSPLYRTSRRPMSATGYSDGRRTQPPPGPLIQHQKGGTMEPPPRPSPAMHQFQNMSLNSPYEESLRLPPLQTQGNHFGPASSRMNNTPRADSQARSVEAMVMTIPYLNKIRVLSKISPPLAPPGPTSPIQDVRGAIIAVEGANSKLVTEVGTFIQAHLSKESECFVKTWSTPLESLEPLSAKEVAMTGTYRQPPRPTTSATSTPPALIPTLSSSPYLPYLSIIQTWHAHSREITNFITTPPTPSSPSPPSPPSSSPLTTTTTTTTAPPTKLPPQQTLPIALLPTGYALSLSDFFASRIPITDAYAPVDHWQWMATLWRGVVGADLTIYVKSASDGGAGEISGAPGDAAAGDAEMQEEIRRCGAVECNWGTGVVVVRVCEGGAETGMGTGHGNGSGSGSESGSGEGPRIEEKTLRRLGFEVLEWVRGGGVGGRMTTTGVGRV